MAKSKRKTIESPSSSSTPSKKIKTKTKTPTSNKRKATVDSEEKPSSKSPKIKHNDTSDDTITNTRSNRKVNSSGELIVLFLVGCERTALRSFAFLFR